MSVFLYIVMVNWSVLLSWQQLWKYVVIFCVGVDFFYEIMEINFKLVWLLFCFLQI